MEEKFYTPTEVGTLIESFRHDVSIIAEEVRGLSSRVGKIEVRLTCIEDRLTHVEDALRVGFPDIFKRLARIESKVFCGE